MNINWNDPYERKKFEHEIKLHQGRRMKWSSSEKFIWAFQIFFLPLLIINGLYGSCAYHIVTNAVSEKEFHEDLMRKEWLKHSNEVRSCLNSNEQQ